MRTRYRHIVTQSSPAVSSAAFTSRVTECNGTVHAPSAGSGFSQASLPLAGEFEHMIDQTGLRVPHAVLHRKWRYTTDGSAVSNWNRYDVPGTQTLSGTGFDFNEVMAGYWKNYIRANGDWDLHDTTYPSPPGWTIGWPSGGSSVVNDLFDRASGLEADVLLNIVEGNQIWPSLKSLASTIPQMRENWKQIRKVLKTASGSYLAWKFGIAPILSDIGNIAKFGPDMNRQYKRFLAGSKTRYSKVIFGTAAYSSAVNVTATDRRTYNGSIVEQPTARYVLVTQPNRHVATSEAFNRFDFAMRRFGSSPASLAWEILPFSFVYDWFVDVRGALRGIDNLLGHKPYEVVSLTRSESYKLQSSVTMDHLNPCGGGGTSYSFNANHSYDYYARNPVSGGDILPTWRPRVGKNQAAIAAALIAQRLFRK